MLHRSIGDDFFQGVDPLVKPRAEQADRPVAAEHHALGAEAVEALIDDRREFVGRPVRGGVGDDAGDFADGVGLISQLGHGCGPRLGLVARLGASTLILRQEGFGVRGAAVVDDEPCVGAALDQFECIVQLGRLDGDFKMFAEFAKQLHGLDELRLQTKAVRRGFHQAAQALDVWIIAVGSDVVSEAVILGSAGNDAGDGWVTGIFRNLGDKFGLVVVLFRDDIDLEVDCLDDIQPLGGSEIIGQVETALEYRRGFVHPRELEAVEIPQVLMSVDDGELFVAATV